MTVCPACDRPELSRAFEVAGAPFLRCKSCGSLIDPQPPEPEERRELYKGSEYFVKDGEGAPAPGHEDDDLWGYPADYISDRAMIEEKFGGILTHLERYVEPGKLIDVGCGPGFLLSVARDRGWDVRGIDLNDWAAEFGREQLGIEIDVGELREAGYEAGSLDAITMMDLIEHVPEPGELIGEAARLVRPGGAMVLLTPDAGALPSRLLGNRWPEVRRPGEHTVLFSVQGLSALLARHGWIACGVHTIGKTASVATLAADVGLPRDGAAGVIRRGLERGRVGEKVVHLDPRTKFVLYARRMPEGASVPGHRPARIPRRAEKLADVEQAIVEELDSLSAASGFCDWMYDQFADRVPGSRVAEVGAGIGTFSRRILDGGAEHLIAIEPEPSCFAELGRRLAGDERVEMVAELLPESPTLKREAGALDLVVCQNVLEHIDDDRAALKAMADALKPGGSLALIVPAGPHLFGPLDEAYGHRRRYTTADLEPKMRDAGLVIDRNQRVNLLGVPGWWVKNLRPAARIGSGSLEAYEKMLRWWRPVEDKLPVPGGLSVVCIARKT